MIKRRLFAILLMGMIISALVCAHIGSAEDGVAGTAGVGQLTAESEKIQKILAELEGIKSESDPAAQVWNKYLSNSTFGKAAIKLGLVLKKADPVFKIVPGMPFSLTGIFFLAFIIMLAVFALARGFLSVTKMPKYATWLLAAGATVVLSVLGLFRLTGKTIANPINMISSVWIRMVVYVVVGVIIIYLDMMALKFTKSEERQRAQKKEMQNLATKTAAREVKKAEARAEQKKGEKKSEKAEESPEEREGKEFLQEIGESLSETGTEKPEKIKTEELEGAFK